MRIRGLSPTALSAPSQAWSAPSTSLALSLAVAKAHHNATCSSILEMGGGGNDKVAVNSAMDNSMLPSAARIAANSACAALAVSTSLELNWFKESGKMDKQ